MYGISWHELLIIAIIGMLLLIPVVLLGVLIYFVIRIVNRKQGGTERESQDRHQ